MKQELSDIFNISGKTVAITGATGYFGSHMAATFAGVGARTVLLGRSAAVLDQAAALERSRGYVADFYKHDELRRVLATVASENAVDVLVNNAFDFSTKTGFNSPDGRLEQSTHEQWTAAFESGIYWAVLATQVLGGAMRTRGSGSIINVSSMYGVVSPHPRLYEDTHLFNPPAYGVVKAGLIALTRYTASFWGGQGVRCNALVPGPFPNLETKTANSVKPDDPFIDRLKRNTVLGRVGHPRELRGALIYLASDASSFMTGQTLVVDGGWLIT